MPFHALNADSHLVQRADEVAPYAFKLYRTSGRFQGTVFIYVTKGTVTVSDQHGKIEMSKGMYGSFPEGCSVDPHRAPQSAYGEFDPEYEIISCHETGLSLRQVGGPIEPVGRLRYIDGCTDTLLLAPPKKGLPCLNLLVIPPGTLQTRHYHPSDRCGVIVDGSGICDAEQDPTGVIRSGMSGMIEAPPCETDGPTELKPGMGWLIPRGLHHRFRTPYGETLRVIAWHPETDSGPTDEDHPMLNRTLVKDGRAVRGVRAQAGAGLAQ